MDAASDAVSGSSLLARLPELQLLEPILLPLPIYDVVYVIANQAQRELFNQALLKNSHLCS